jgi:hypothetical protein
MPIVTRECGMIGTTPKSKRRTALAAVLRRCKKINLLGNYAMRRSITTRARPTGAHVFVDDDCRRFKNGAVREG